MSTKRSHRGTRRGALSPIPPGEIDPALARFLDELESDPYNVSGVGRSERERRILAEVMAEFSNETPDVLPAIAYALRAVRLNPAALDARLLLAVAAGGPQDEFVEELQKILAVGEADLGPKFFAERRGDFGLAIECRPYMRVRARLAYELHALGRTREAIRHCEEILKLDSDDRQGLRYVLVGLYLEVNDLAATGRLMDDYKDDSTAMFLWGRVLERYLSGDLAGAAHSLQAARKQNPHVEDFLTGRKKVPKKLPQDFILGETSEAIECMHLLGAAWSKNPEAVEWLKKETGSRRPLSSETKRKRTIM